MVSVLPPHVVHDGRTAGRGGYRKRVVYLETSLLPEDLTGPAVDGPVLQDPGLRPLVAALHDALECPDDALEAETRLQFVVERIRTALDETPSPVEPPRDELADALRAYLDGHLFEAITLSAASAAVGGSQTQVARAFSSEFGITPHAYVIGRRLDTARRRILDGQPLADVAAELGFYDQAHLTRRFRRFLGTTPGHFGH